LLIIPPATVLGMIYPGLLASGLRGHNRGGWFAGYLSAFNSIGCLLGALVTTFVLVPYLGSELSLKLIIVVLATLSLAFKAREPGSWKTTRLIAVLGFLTVVTVTIPRRWEWTYLTSGLSMYFGEATASERRPDAEPSASSTQTIIFKEESIQGGFTTVVEAGAAGSHAPIRSLYANGKFQGDNDPQGEARVQVGIAAVPCLFNKRFDRALVIGMGTAHSAGVLHQLGFRAIDVAELSPGIIHAAESEFGDLNRNILHDPSVTVSIEDGRNLLLTHKDRQYDLITVELAAIWFSGATNLYSKEFFELAHDRLQPDGVLQQWIQLHRIGPDEIASVIATARSVFPYVSYWTYGGQGMLMAANQPISVTPERIALLETRFRESNYFAADQAHSVVEKLSGGELLSQAAADRMIRERRPVINTDHNRHIEYATPRYASSELDWRAYNLAVLRSWNQ